MDDDLETRFEQAAEEVQHLPERPAGDDLLDLYSHYKQATSGDVQGERPGFTDFVGRAKYDAWARLKGMSAEDARRRYIAKVHELKAGT